MTARDAAQRFRKLSRALGAAVFVAACLVSALGAAWVFTRVFAPQRRASLAPPSPKFEAGAMRSATSPDSVAQEQARILAFGARYLGDPGLYATERYLRSAFQDLNLEVFEQSMRTSVPRTRYREIYSAPPGGARGARLTDVEVYPFMPNHLQPVVTGDAGIVGELVLLDEKTLATRRDFSDVIGLIDAAPGAYVGDLGFHWARYAGLGVKALIVSHRQGLAALDWISVAKQTSGIVSSVPVNFTRLAATSGIFAHLGERVRLRVRVDFEETENRTLFGLLRAKNPAEEALVISAPYDAPAILPDLAPGALPAVDLAYLLALARGLAGARDTLTRDVIFMTSGSSVMGEDGLNALLRVLRFNTFASRSNRLLDAFDRFEVDAQKLAPRGASSVLEERLDPIRESILENDKKLSQVNEIERALREPQFLLDRAATLRKFARFAGPTRSFFDAQFQYVLNTLVVERQEPLLAQKLALERAGDERTDTPAFLRYLELRRELDAVSAAAGSSAPVLLANNQALAREVALRERVRRRFDELIGFHRARQRELHDDAAVAELFSRYREFAFLRPAFAPAPTADAKAEVTTLYAQSTRETQSVDNLLQASARELGLVSDAFHVEALDQNPSNQLKLIDNNCEPAPTAYYTMAYSVGYQSYGIVNLNRQPAYQAWSYPVVLPFMRDLASLRGSFASFGELTLRLSHGSGLIGSTQGYPWQRKRFAGKVLLANVGQSVVPSYPLAHALVGARSMGRTSMDQKELHSRPGFWVHPFYATDPYGKFDLREQAADFGVWWRMYSDGYAFTPVAVGFGEDGRIAYMKDEGDESQRLFRSINVPLTNEQLVQNVTLVAFRAAPVTIVDLTNPQNFKDYSGVEMITTQGLTPFEKLCQFPGLGFVTTYLPPDQRADVLLQSSRPDNEYVKETRAFLLGPPARSNERELAGSGYLAADHPFLLDVPFEAAASMTRVNGKRLELQNRYGMADERTNAYHQKALALLRASRSPSLSERDAALKARDAVSYAGLNHPVLRESVFEAVIGILWYLGLLVPFVFFAEKLIFCYADVRRQIAAQFSIFLLIFLALRVLHPAFEMVRSSLMILLGFVIIMISTGITLIFANKAGENLRELRKRQGQVAGAEVNTLGVLTAAFLVGLNNMHRRKVRSGLTCATLVLLTFVMICFTSTQNDLVDQSVTLGRAEYQGVLAKHDDFAQLSENEVFALKSKFADRFVVSERRYFTGDRDWNERKRMNPALSAGFVGPDGERKAPLASILRLSSAEPLRDKLELVTHRGWFTPAHMNDSGPCPLLVPDKLADRLGIRAEAVDAGDVTLSVNERPFRVWGIFKSESLAGLKDLDGHDLLPFDIERVANIDENDFGLTVPDDSPRVSAEKVLIAPLRDLKLGTVAYSRDVIASVAVDMGKVSYREAKAEIDAHLEKTALPAFYGLDGVAYRGLRTRKLTLEGLLDLLVPLLIAGLTVLNTMRGSVYERRGEIYVYNAVGIAPRYILAMFFAEAFVYAVVGSVLGYLLSQGVGRVLTHFGWTFGLNMTFASLSTIYASLAIVAAVFVSTWFPARSAMEIAAPAEESGWKLPEPNGDVLAFDLPFNFRQRGRLAVLAFFERWLREHGEGSAGPFFASPPNLGIASELDLATARAVPEMRLTVWLKPFDLAVSEELVITTPFDVETQQFKARLELARKSGTREAWLRLNRTFVAELRRHFLHWRAVPDRDRNELFDEARAELEARYPEWALPREVTS